jgi:hypothetical protein
MKIEQLPDEELATQAKDWRRRALQGEADAKGLAHRCEVELRRRFGMPEPATFELQPPSLDVPLPAPRAPRWRWRLI